MLQKINIKQLVLIFIVAVAVFFRFWAIKNYVVFLGDEGRDMIILRRIFTEGDLPFIGPTASVGGFYLGPVYYWMTAPFLLLFNFDPVGPSYFVAFIGVLTVFLLYKFLKEAVGFWPAALTSLLYAIAPLIVRYSRSSWNPNPLPFFSLLFFYFIYLGIKFKKNLYFIVAGAAIGIAIQLHYLALVLPLLSIFIITITTNYKKWPMIFSLQALGGFITFSPLLIFEATHDFPNFKTILEFVTRGSTVGYHDVEPSWLIINIGNILLEYISGLKGTIFTRIYFWILTAGAVVLTLKRKENPKLTTPLIIALIWFFGGLAGVRLYQGSINDYYFGFMFPAPFFLFGLILGKLWEGIWRKATALSLTAIPIFFFFLNGFYIHPPNNLIKQTSDIADIIIEKANNKPFNFALISEGNSDHAYRYFLEIKDHKPLLLEENVTQQLIILCEAKKCEPLGHPLWEIAAFGRGEITDEWNLEKYGFRIFRLKHWPGAPSLEGKPAIKGG